MSAPRRHSRVVAPVLVGLALIIGLVGALATWAERQALEGAGWQRTGDELIQDPVVREALASYLTDELYANVDVAGLLRANLPGRSALLADPAAAALRRAALEAAEQGLERPRVQAAWSVALERSHRLARLLLDGGGDRLSTTGGAVTLDLGLILREVAADSGLGDRIAAAIPPGAGTIELIRSDELTQAQFAVRLLEAVAWIAPLVALALLAAALAIAQGHRRETLRLASIGVAGLGLVLIILRPIVGDWVVGALDPQVAYREAVEHTWQIATSLWRELGLALLLYGLVGWAAASLAGPGGWAVATRRAARPLTPPLRAHGVSAGLCLFLLWWGPTEGLRRLWIALILLALIVVGIEFLRRQIIREAAAEDGSGSNGDAGPEANTEMLDAPPGVG